MIIPPTPSTYHGVSKASTMPGSIGMSLSAAMNGLHALVFTGGIGENAGSVRERICNELGFLGISIDPTLNAKGLSEISQRGAPTRVFVIPTNEELMIARHTRRLLANGEQEETP